jgi:hypothetical protein
MLYTDFCNEFDKSISRQDVPSAYRALMQELGRILVRDKQDFVDLLNESGYEAEITDSDADLVDIFSENISSSPSLMLGASMLTASHNKKMGFDGEDEYLDDRLVKSSYRVIQSAFSGELEESSNAVGAVLGATAAGAGLAKSIIDRKTQKEGAGMKAFEQKEATRQQLLSGVLQAKQQQAETAKKQQEEKAKSRRTLYIIGGSVLGLAVIGVIIYAIKKRRK